MNLTKKHILALADVSDGDWVRLTDYHGKIIVGNLRNAGLIRCDFDDLPATGKRYTITPDGEQALGAHQ